VGVLGLIDEGETDWKLLGIDIRDKLASQVIFKNKQNFARKLSLFFFWID
jgi:inorganic pyrophosphatase